MARSSPKFGSVTMMPSIESWCLRKRSAQRCDFFASLDRTIFRFLGSQRDDAVAALFDGGQHLFAPAFREMIRKESTIPDNHPERDFSF